LLLIFATLACRPLGSSAPSTQEAGTSCEYIGVRFVPPAGWSVKEESDGEPLSRITLQGSSAGHQVLASLFARETLPSAERTPSGQAHAYFQKFQAATASEPFTDFIETSFEDSGRTYPALGYRERLPGPLPAMDVQQETIVGGIRGTLGPVQRAHAEARALGREQAEARVREGQEILAAARIHDATALRACLRELGTSFGVGQPPIDRLRAALRTYDMRTIVAILSDRISTSEPSFGAASSRVVA